MLMGILGQTTMITERSGAGGVGMTSRHNAAGMVSLQELL
jgi:hypothetical protein